MKKSIIWVLLTISEEHCNSLACKPSKLIKHVNRSEDQINFLHSLLGQSTAIAVMEVLEKAAPDRVFSRHRIQEAEEQIEIINQNLQEIVKKIEEKQVEIALTRSTLNSLKSQDTTLRYHVVRRNEALDPLHLALDKLSFAHSAYRDKSITISCSQDIDYRIRRLHYRMIYSNMSRKDEEENIRRQIKLLESEKERVIINCVVGGKLWRSFGSRKDIQNRINEEHKNADEMRVTHRRVQTGIKRVTERLNRLLRGERKLRTRMDDLRGRKQQVFQQILDLRRQQNFEHFVCPELVSDKCLFEREFCTSP
ncbi:Proton pump-interactor 1 [Linum perenne]